MYVIALDKIYILYQYLIQVLEVVRNGKNSIFFFAHFIEFVSL